MRVAYFCMRSVFSVRPLRALLAAGHDVCCVVQPRGGVAGRRRTLLQRERGVGRRMRHRLLGHLEPPDAPRQDPFVWAEAHGVPRYWVGDASAPPVQTLLARERIDIVAIAFFNQLLKPALLERLPAGAVNAHPSLLPRHRGPSPLFWTYYEGDADTGVTVHQVTTGEDEGPAYGSRSVSVPLGLPGEQLLEGLADAAEGLLVDGMAAQAGGAVGLPQRRDGVTRAPRPTDRELRLSPSWPARRLFHVVRGVGRWVTLVLEVDGRLFRAIDARGWDEERRPPGEWALMGDVLLLGCSPGTVELSVVPLSG